MTLGKLPGPEHVSRIGEEGSNLDRTGPHIHLAVRKGKHPFVRMDAPVGKNQMKRHLLGPSIMNVHQVLLLAHRDVYFDRVNSRNGCQFLYGSRPDKVADLRLGDASDTVYGRHDSCEAKVQLGLFCRSLGRNNGGLSSLNRGLGSTHSGLSSIDRGLSRLVGTDGVIQILLAHGVLFCKRPDSLQIGTGSKIPRLGLRDVGPGLFQRGLSPVPDSFCLVPCRIGLIECGLKGAGSISKRICPFLTKSPSV